MTDLIAMVSTGKGTWTSVSALVNKEKWNKIYVITNDFGKEKFNKSSNMEFILVDQNKSVNEMKEIIISSLKGKIKGEAGVNFISGTGKEHMALLGAIMKLGIGFRLVDVENNGLEEV